MHPSSLRITMLLAISLWAGYGQAMTMAMAMDEHKPAAYTEDSTRHYADGRVVKHHVEQTVLPDGWVRSVTDTNAKGQTSSRKVTMHRDKAQHAWSCQIEGVSFDGKHYDMHAEGHGFPPEGLMEGHAKGMEMMGH
ncbi:MAG: hypothetical protein HKM02_06820 [Pseudomonadales bacterium]|nr:hypothetical protein [Pseudomonadales bacterium]